MKEAVVVSAVRVATGATGNANVHVVAFKHATLNNFVVMAMNSSTSSYSLSLTGTGVGNRPSLGAWVTYGLGSDNDNLPGFVVLFSNGETTREPGCRCRSCRRSISAF